MSIVFLWSEQYALDEHGLDRQHRFLYDLGKKFEQPNKNRQNHM